MEEFIKKIKKEYNIDVTQNIDVNTNYVVLQNNERFDFGKIFVIDALSTGLDRSQFYPFGTSEDNNIYILKEYYDILKSYYVVYMENEDKFILKLWEK
jgi:hypothetical protein